MKRPALDDPRHYLNRHVEWLQFNRRVLEEARDLGNPLLERVKFLAITANNLDEFVEIRVSSFLQRIEHGSREISPDGLTAEQELEKVSAAMHALCAVPEADSSISKKCFSREDRNPYSDSASSRTCVWIKRVTSVCSSPSAA